MLALFRLIGVTVHNLGFQIEDLHVASVIRKHLLRPVQRGARCTITRALTGAADARLDALLLALLTASLGRATRVSLTDQQGIVVTEELIRLFERVFATAADNHVKIGVVIGCEHAKRRHFLFIRGKKCDYYLLLIKN